MPILLVLLAQLDVASLSLFFFWLLGGNGSDHGNDSYGEIKMEVDSCEVLDKAGK